MTYSSRFPPLVVDGSDSSGNGLTGDFDVVPGHGQDHGWHATVWSVGVVEKRLLHFERVESVLETCDCV